MTQALEFERLRVVPEADAADQEEHADARAGAGAADEESSGGLFVLLDRLFFAALGAVQGAAEGWANPSWVRKDADAESSIPLPTAVEAVMTRTVQVIGPDANLEEAARRLWDRDCGALPVVGGSSGRLVLGMITDRDVCMAAWSRGTALPDVSVRSAMARRVLLCRADDSISDAHRQMREGQVRRLPVVDEDGDLIGVVSVADLIRHALGAPVDTRRAEALAVLKTLGAIGIPTRPVQTSS